MSGAVYAFRTKIEPFTHEAVLILWVGGQKGDRLQAEYWIEIAHPKWDDKPPLQGPGDHLPRGFPEYTSEEALERVKGEAGARLVAELEDARGGKSVALPDMEREQSLTRTLEKLRSGTLAAIVRDSIVPELRAKACDVLCRKRIMEDQRDRPEHA
jgi:hypothetical protein